MNISAIFSAKGWTEVEPAMVREWDREVLFEEQPKAVKQITKNKKR
jgi:hypothetical protein